MAKYTDPNDALDQLRDNKDLGCNCSVEDHLASNSLYITGLSLQAKERLLDFIKAEIYPLFADQRKHIIEVI